MEFASAVKAINQNGVLLVFPIKNARRPPSLWFALHPRSKMRWEWDDGGDNKVFDLWHLMKRLSDCRQVVYSKWYRGRATFFSRELFTAMLCVHFHEVGAEEGLAASALTAGLPSYARNLLDILESDSPLSTKELKSLSGLQGKFHEATYNRGMKELYTRLLAVTFGEVDDGAFPSNAVGATRTLYEDLWESAAAMDFSAARAVVDRFLPEGCEFRRFFDRNLRRLRGSA